MHSFFLPSFNKSEIIDVNNDEKFITAALRIIKLEEGRRDTLNKVDILKKPGGFFSVYLHLFKKLERDLSADSLNKIQQFLAVTDEDTLEKIRSEYNDEIAKLTSSSQKVINKSKSSGKK